ncbi:MAG TPA: condensation domain-containing protein, partial [Pyrinomonadaceae bacterium]|nr:condensation domain-containing protein [Pyrinomonadaceae bacterium]
APFDEEKFRRAVAYVVARHAMLRTSFDLRSFREPLQIVHREAVLPVGVEDITHLSADEQERAVDDFIRREETNLFDLSRPPLLRFYIHRRSADTFQFTLTENHAIFDGWSLHATLAEVFEVYFRVMDGEELPGPPEVSVTYRDFVRLEQEALASDECRRFWEEKLADFTPLILPRRPAERRRREGARLPSVRVPVSPELSGALKESARRAGVPLKTVLLAAHLKVMSILTGQTDIVTGMATHGRPEEADGEVARGLFLNTLAFRMDVSASTWAELARRTFAAECELLPHRRYPFAAVQQGRDGGPMFEAMFNFIQFHVIDGVLQSGNLEVLDFKKAESTNFPLLVTFNLTEVTSQLGLEINYNPEELSDEQVESIGGYFARALAAMAEDADARHDLQSFLSEDERRRVLVEWNDTKSLYERDTCVHELFEQRAAETPGSVALVFGDEQVTYGELNARSNRLARHLRALGVGADSLVALCAERSVEMVVGLLAVLKAGGAYVPLDAAYPPERLTFMLEDTNARVLLTQARLAPRLPAHDAEVVLLDDDQTRFADES